MWAGSHYEHCWILSFLLPETALKHCKSYFTVVYIWPSLDKKDHILELLICLIIALGISYCLFIPLVFNVTVCSDLVRRCENSLEGILLAQWEDEEQRPPLNAQSPVPGLMAWQFQGCSHSTAGWQDRGWNFAQCIASYEKLKNTCAFVRYKRRTVSQLIYSLLVKHHVTACSVLVCARVWLVFVKFSRKEHSS